MKNIVLLWHNNNNSTDKHIKCSLFFTIFHLTMVSSVMDCIGNRNLRQRSSKVNHVCYNVSKHVLMWVFRPCIVHFYVITFIVTFADFEILSFFYLFQEALLPLSVEYFLGRHGLLDIKHFLKWNQFMRLPLDEPHRSAVPTECHHPGHFLLHCVFQWGTVKGIQRAWIKSYFSFRLNSLRDLFGDGVFKFKSFSSLRFVGVLYIFTLT